MKLRHFTTDNLGRHGVVAGAVLPPLLRLPDYPDPASSYRRAAAPAVTQAASDRAAFMTWLRLLRFIN